MLAEARGGDFVKGEVPGSAGYVSANTPCTRVVGRIVDLALGDESGVNVAVLNARVRYKTDAGLVKAKWVPLNISLEGKIVYAYIVCLRDHLKKDIEKDSVTHKFVNTGTVWYVLL